MCVAMAMMNGHSRHGDEEEERAVEDMIKLEYVALFFKLLFVFYSCIFLSSIISILI